MDVTLKWYQQVCVDILWVFCLLCGALPRFVRYYMLRPLFFAGLVLAGYRRKMIVRNLTHSFPEKSVREIRKIACRNYLFMAEVFVDTISLAGASRRRKSYVAQWVNGEEVGERLRGKDWIAMCAHYGCWEYLMLFCPYLKNTKLMGVYHPLNNAIFDRLYSRLRNLDAKIQQVPVKQSVRYFLQNRKEGYGTLLGLISDQSPKLRSNTHWVKFLHQDTAFFDGGEALARKFHLPVFFVHCRRIAPGRYAFTLEEIYDGKEELAPDELTERYARKLEGMIRECPEIWLWSHNRWKHTPEKQARRFGKSTMNMEQTSENIEA